MSEKRFQRGMNYSCFDTETGKSYWYACNLCGLLSEMSDKIDEQQAIIQSLQDLCGKSDYENAKLRLKNKEQAEEIKLLKPTNVEQYEQIVQLQEENEQLRQEKESWKSIACQDLSKWSIFSNEVSVLHETRDIDRFLEKYYKYCEDMIKEE